MSRTDHVLAAIARELAIRRCQIDPDAALRQVTITVKMDARTGAPFRVLYRAEGERPITGV